MTDPVYLVLTIFCGIITVTVIDVVGSITSRKFGYLYAYLSPLSFTVYTLVGYFVSKAENLSWAIAAACMVGIYDATVGWKLSVFLSANFGRFKQQNLEMTVQARVIATSGIGIIFGSLGYFIARKL